MTDNIWFLTNLKMRYHPRPSAWRINPWTTLIGLIVGFLPGLAVISGQVTPPSGNSDPQAIATVQRAITAMGGAPAWQLTGGATAQVTIISPNLPSRTVNWTDDWSTGRIRFRRDSATTGESSTSSLIGTDTFQIHLRQSGSQENVQHDDPIAVLAIGYPAAALILSLSPQYACTFHLGRAVNPRAAATGADASRTVVTELCADPFFPRGSAAIVWIFASQSGTPASVVLPVWGQTTHTVLEQTITYASFHNENGLTTPSSLTIKRVSGWTDQIHIANTSFLAHIPANTFSLSR